MLDLIYTSILNIINSKVSQSVTFSRLNRYIDSNEILYRDTLIFEKKPRLLFIAISNIHRGGAAGKLVSYKL